MLLPKLRVENQNSSFPSPQVSSVWRPFKAKALVDFPNLPLCMNNKCKMIPLWWRALQDSWGCRAEPYIPVDRFERSQGGD
jgi:hypothetical protein